MEQRASENTDYLKLCLPSIVTACVLLFVNSHVLPAGSMVLAVYDLG